MTFGLASHCENSIGVRGLVDNPSRDIERVDGVFKPVSINAIGINAQNPVLRPLGRSGGIVLDCGPGLRQLLGGNAAVLLAGAYLQAGTPAPQQAVNRGCHIGVDGKAVPCMNFNQHVEGRRCLPFLHGLLSAPPPGFVIAQGD